MPTLSELRKLILPGVVLIVGLVLLLGANTTLAHTLGSSRLIWICGLGGLVLAIPVALLMHDLDHYVRSAFMAMLAVGFALCATATAGFVNYRFSPKQPTTVQAEVIDKISQADGKNGGAYYLVTNRSPGLPLKVSYRRWMNTPISYPVRISMIPGYLGFPYVQGLVDAEPEQAR